MSKSEKQFLLILWSSVGRIIYFKLLHYWNVSSGISFTLQPSSKTTSTSYLQPLNSCPPSFSVFLGILTFATLVPAKQRASNSLTETGNSSACPAGRVSSARCTYSLVTVTTGGTGASYSVTGVSGGTFASLGPAFAEYSGLFSACASLSATILRLGCCLRASLSSILSWDASANVI